MAELKIDDDQVSITGITGDSFKSAYVSWDMDGYNAEYDEVWVDTYNYDLNDRREKLAPHSTFGWITAEEAEMLAMALLYAVKKFKEEREDQ